MARPKLIEGEESITTGISLPKPMLKTIDDLRGDVPRSVFIRNAIEEAIKKRRIRYLGHPP
jgi:metal-responsive CopG/Arc/MetJ family transcriptional regulator